LRGTYLPGFRPKDAKTSPKTTNGVLEFPIRLTQATIYLKAFHRLKWIETNLDGSNPQISKGKWKSSGKMITLDFKGDSIPLFTMELVRLKSGTYIKPLNDYFHYYKKK
jgi:hypothetical protein